MKLISQSVKARSSCCGVKFQNGSEDGRDADIKREKIIKMFHLPCDPGLALN